MFGLNFVPCVLASEFGEIELRWKYISWILHLVILVTEFCDFKQPEVVIWMFLVLNLLTMNIKVED